MVLTTNNPCLGDADASSGCFQARYSLLCRWQTQLEFFLYQLCQIAAPRLVDECHWSCPEAAELSRLSERITEYFCFHHKQVFQTHGISETEREAFCSNMHGIRQIRHCAVHRVPASAITIARYAKMVKNVLLISRRLGGAEFENEYGGSLDHFLDTLWDIKGHNIPSAQPQPESFQGRYYNPIEANTTNVQRMLELQNVALERKLENITRMVENIEIAQAQKSARRARLTQQNYEAEQRRIERAQRNQQEREKAEQRRIEKAQRNQQQRDEAEQRRIEKEKRSRHDLDVAQNKRIERAKRNQSDSDERIERAFQFARETTT